MELANELVSMRRRIMKRRIMEPQQGQNGGGGGEVRRVHIIYFLSRKGRIEHPHLIRVHHLSRNGVRLRDVKRWLSELRGKDMPESFAWSYKRRYKAGYVWQDLLDEDLITPISDNEYVLKGSEIASTIFGNDLHTYGEKKMSTDDQEHPPLENIEIESKDQKVSSKEAIQEHPQTKIDVMAKTSSEIEEESPPFSSDTLTTLTEDSTKLEEKKPLDTSKQGIKGQSDKFENNSIDYFYSNHLNNNNTNNNNKNKNKTNSGTTSSSSTSSRSSFTRSKSYSSGASNMLRSLITCGTVDTNDSAVVMTNRRDKSGASNGCTKGMDSCTAELSKGEKLGGSERMFGTTLNQQYQDNGARKSYDGAKGTKKKKNKSEFSNKKPLSAAYKPVNGPNCSQCGKMFKPEKLHTHMKSCRGMKTLAKGASPAASMKAQSHSSSMDDSSFQQSASGYYLTHN